MIRSRPMVIPATALVAGMTPPPPPKPPKPAPPKPKPPTTIPATTPDPRLRAGRAYADPDLHTTPAGSYHRPGHYAHVSDGPPPPQPPPTPGEQLRDWRHRACLSQAQVGRAIGAATWQISRWERGLDPVPRGTLTRLARAHRLTTRTTR